MKLENFSIPPLQILQLAGGSVHVFSVSLDLPPGRLEQLAETLSKDERQRAARFIFERDRNRFVAGRGILREILGRILHVQPGQLEFSYGPRGKPQLAAPVNGDFLHFNLAHSDSLAVYAVSREHEVGVDLERIRPIQEADQIVEQFFSESECVQWLSLPDGQKTEAFFNCWTRKEAVLKASGEGIDELSNQDELSFMPNVSAKSFFHANCSHTGRQWSVMSLMSIKDFAAAVAVGSSLKRFFELDTAFKSVVRAA